MTRDNSEEAVAECRNKFGRSLNAYQKLLLDVCFGRKKVPASVEPLNSYVTASDLRKMHTMVLMEFIASIEKERTGTEDAKKTGEPHPFDIFLIEAAPESADCRMAVCLPFKENLVWYDGTARIWPLGALRHKWRVASLAGPARILEALETDSQLKQWAMAREMCVSAETRIKETEETHPMAFKGLNESQKQAVATVASPNFTNGFFAVQGPPGCG